MNYRDELQGAVEALASNPKLSIGVSTATASLGVASATEVITGTLSAMAMIAGIVVSTMLGRVHWASYKNHLIQNKILRQQLIDMGGDPDKEDA